MTNYDSSLDTLSHIVRVSTILKTFIMKILIRCKEHDKTKLEPPEKEFYDINTPILNKLVYNSEEYKNNLENLKEALKHHYSQNRHHPEYHENGINDMTLIDLIEMLADWKAASERHSTGNILKSIESNQQRFGIDPQLTQILINTVKELN